MSNTEIDVRGYNFNVSKFMDLDIMYISEDGFDGSGIIRLEDFGFWVYLMKQYDPNL